MLGFASQSKLLRMRGDVLCFVVLALLWASAGAAQTITTDATLPEGEVGVSYNTQLSATGGQLPYAGWQITAGSLPNGVDLNAASGRISGTPTESGSFDFTVQVTDSVGANGTKDFTLVIAPPALQIETTSLPDGTVGSSYDTALSAVGGTQPYTWSTASGSLPPGLSLGASSGQIQGTPTTPGDFSFGVEVLDDEGNAARASLMISVSGEPLQISTTSLGDAVVGENYSQTVQATGGSPPYGPWSIAGGALPNGLDISPTSGAITGIPAAVGSASFTVEVSDSTGSTAQQALTIDVQPPTLTITSPSVLPSGNSGVSYSFTLQAAGGTPPYVGWDIVDGDLPTGLQLNPNNGLISGTPPGQDSETFTVEVTDSAGATAQATLQLTIEASELQITNDSPLPAARLGIVYSVRLAASGGRPPYTIWRVISGALPDGLNIQPTSGEIRGTPTATGEFAFAVSVEDSRGSVAEKSFTLSVESSDVLISTTVLPAAIVGEPYTAALTAVGGTQPYSNWRILSGALPPDLTLDPASGVIAGTAVGVVEVSLEIAVDDALGATATRVLAFRSQAPAPTVFPVDLPDAVINEAYTAQLVAQGGTPPYENWRVAIGELPPGLAIDAETGVLAGTPTVEGNFQFTIAVDDSTATTGGRAYLMAVVPDALRITTLPRLPDATVGGIYTLALVAAGGEPPYVAWRLVSGALPNGLALDPATGVLSGAPSEEGSFQFVVEVEDSEGTTAGRNHLLDVASAPLSIETSAELPPAALGETYTHVFAAQGGTPPYALWILLAGALPPGISLDPNAGSISGTPSTAGVFTFDMQVRDSAGGAVTKQLQLRVLGPAEPLALESPSCGDAFLGVTYSCTLSGTGGRPPYAWSIISGALPAGVSLDPQSGAVTGRPTVSGVFAPEIRLADSEGRETTSPLTFTVALPEPSIELLDNPGPAQQRRVRLFSTPAYPAGLSGTLTLTFEPNAVNNADDPAVQLSSGGRSVPFTIAANGTEASFPAGGLELQTGTVAGTIALAVTELAVGDVALPAGDAPLIQESVPREPPTIAQISVTNVGENNFTVEVVGFSTIRQLSEARFSFRAAAGRTLQNANATVSLGEASTTWYGSTDSTPFGGQFRYSQPFTTTNGADAIAGVTVILVNEQGESEGASANF